MSDWVREEAARQAARATTSSGATFLSLAESCLRAGLREAARRAEASADEVYGLSRSGTNMANTLRAWAADLRALAGEEPTP